MTSLVDPTNPALWADGSERSQNNGFTHGFGEPIDWKPMQRRANLRQTSSKAVERQRAQGLTVGSIPLMGKKLERNRLAMISIENAEAGRASTDKRSAIRRGGI